MIIDLTVTLDEHTPVYPGDPGLKLAPTGQLDRDGYEAHVVTLGTHLGTHIDAPAHMVPGGRTLDQVPLNTFQGPGRLLALTDGDFDRVRDLQLQSDDIVLFATGMSQKFHDPVYFEDYPVMSAATAQFLVDSQVKMVGVDTCSVDNQDSFPVHKCLLSAGMVIIENLTNLSALNGHSFEVYALPLKLSLDGAPARVVARITE